MRSLRLFTAILFLGFVYATSVYATRPISSNCDALGRINGIYYTSCFPWSISSPADGTISFGIVNVHNDTARLQYAIQQAYGKLVFNEGDYYIDDELPVYSYRTLIGTGRETYADPSSPNVYLTSKIIQTNGSKSIFTIGGSINSVAIRDIGLTALLTGRQANNTVGILAQNGTTEATSYQSTDFEFTNLTFTGLDKGIYLNARYYPSSNPNPAYGAEGFWRFDNVKLDHIRFANCHIGVHTNSNNTGWSMKNLYFSIPPGSQIPDDTETDPVNSSTLPYYTFGLYLQRISYSIIDEVIADGPIASTNTSASVLVYVGQHGNLNMQSMIDEGFKNSVFIFGGDINNPINMTNNYFQSPVRIRNSWVVSTANQFNFPPSSAVRPAAARLSSKIFSVGDKFCFDTPPYCTDSTDATYDTDASSVLVFSSNSYRNALSALRIGQPSYYFDAVRNQTTGYLDFTGNQGTLPPYGTIGYSGYTFNTPGGAVKINYDGSVTYGNKSYSNIIANTGLASAPPDGTVIYCPDCQKATPCNTGGSGALAKRINGGWDCD
jgi:hypothetical protein